MTETLCPCGSTQPFANCCQPYLRGDTPPPTAEALMRSRYSAYCQQDMAYLRKSWHPSTCPASLSPDPTIQWLSLSVLNTQEGLAQHTHGEVEFIARFMLNGGAETLHERSQFVQEKGHWLYLNGLTELPAQQKISRNAPCPCGSGKKYKKCCLASS